MIERHYTGGFSTDPNQEKNTAPREKALDLQERTRRNFSAEYDIPTLAQSVYQEVTESEATIPLELQQKLINHLENEFGRLNADKDVAEELIREEAVRYIKMFAR